MQKQPEDRDMNVMLERWLKAIAMTEDDEMDCDSLFEVMDKAAELAKSGKDVRVLLPQIGVHVDRCPDCREIYDSLEALAKEPR